MYTKTYKRSRASYPDGILAVYDNRGRSIDRYFVVFTPDAVDGVNWFTTLAMSAKPSSPYGVGITGQYRTRPTRAKGDRVIDFTDLPEDCQRCVTDLIEGAA
jgi:hypothetical protein